jgi:hypothetical protein
MTNLEWLRSLSAEELANKLHERPVCQFCVNYNYKTGCMFSTSEDDDSHCVKGMADWLNAKHILKIKPCPVCKGKMNIESNHGGCYLVCPDCGLHFGIDAEAAEQGIIEGGYSTRASLVDAWNLILDTES